MASQPTNFLDELVAAARGCLALAVGDRKAPDWFDFSRRGLYGAAIAFLVSLAAQTYEPLLTGAPIEPGMVTRSLVVSIFLVGAQVAATAIVLRQINRLDALAPYLVASGWVTFFATVALLVLSLVGLATLPVVLVVVVGIFVLEINIARLIMTMTALQIGTMLVAQLVGVFLALLIIGLLVPLPPELAAEVAASLNQ